MSNIQEHPSNYKKNSLKCLMDQIKTGAIFYPKGVLHCDIISSCKNTFKDFTKHPQLIEQKGRLLMYFTFSWILNEGHQSLLVTV